MTTGPLDGVRVVDLASYLTAPFAARLLADLGAEVTKVELSAGDVTRTLPPLVEDDVAHRHSGLFQMLNSAKRVVVVDAGDDGSIDALLRDADIVLLSDCAPSGGAPPVDATTMRERYPQLVVSIARAMASCAQVPDMWRYGLNAIGLSGLAVAIGAPDRAPLPPPYDIMDYYAGVHLAGASLVALLAARTDGEGDIVEVAVADVVLEIAVTISLTMTNYGKPFYRAGRRSSGSAGAYPFGIFPAADGQAVLIGRSSDDWAALVRMMGEPEWAHDPRFADPFDISAYWADEVDEHVFAWSRGKSRAELLALGREHDFPIGPVHRVDETLAMDHFAERRTFSDPVPVGTSAIRVPFQPWQFSRTPLSHARTPAGSEGIAVARSEDGPAFDAQPPERPPFPVVPPLRDAPRPLEGLRVIDLGWVWAGPGVSATLADLGADVIKVENRDRLDNARLRGRPVNQAGEPLAGPIEELSPYFHRNNRGKRSVTLDLKHPDDRSMLEQLIVTSDVVVENLRPGVFDRAGLGYTSLADQHPGLIWLAMSVGGKYGPLVGMRGYAPVISAFAGVESLVGYEDDEPVGMMSSGFGDANSVAFGLLAVLAALHERRTSGLGQFIDMAQIECTIAVLPEPITMAQLHGTSAPPQGMSHLWLWPYGMFACREHDSWIAITCSTDAERARLAAAIGADAAEGADRDRLDAAVCAWCSARDLSDAVATLGAARVAASPVLDLLDTLGTAEFAHAFQEVDHPVTGVEPVMPYPWRFGRWGIGTKRPGPLIGQHTREVLRERLGVSDDVIEQVVARHGEVVVVEESGMG